MNCLRLSGEPSLATCSADTVVPRITTMSAPAFAAMGASSAVACGEVATATVMPADFISAIRAVASSVLTGFA